MYYNNYWQAPAAMRLIASGTAFWQLAEMVGSDKYINYSSLSMNLQSLLDVGLWIPNKVNDDSGFYWKAYYHFNGDYKVKEESLKLLFILVTHLKQGFKKLAVAHVPREQNKLADEEANRALDQEFFL